MLLLKQCPGRHPSANLPALSEKPVCIRYMPLYMYMQALLSAHKNAGIHMHEIAATGFVLLQE